jgi:cytochrome bd-type quinol oxidase subunit 2
MNWLLGLIGVLAVVAFVISGILYLTAAGDEEQIERAKSTMMFAIIGLVVALVGLVIVNAVGGITGGNNNAGNF